MAGKQIDPARARGALSVVKQHPGMTLFALSPALLGVALVWWLAGAGWAIVLVVAAGLGGALLIARRR